MELTAVIVDDEERGILTLQSFIRDHCTGLVVEGTALNIKDAERIIKKVQPDIVFLDIEMPDGNGFKLLEGFEEIDFNVVFVTAYQEYAIKAIKFSALDYLLKPVSIEDIQSVIDKTKKLISAGKKKKYNIVKDQFRELAAFNKIMLSTIDAYYPVRLQDIIYCKADDSYTHFYLQEGKHYLVSRHLKEFDDMLTSHSFFRIHKSFLINIEHVKQITKSDSPTVIMCNLDELPLSYRKRDEFLEKMKNA